MYSTFLLLRDLSTWTRYVLNNYALVAIAFEHIITVF